MHALSRTEVIRYPSILELTENGPVKPLWKLRRKAAFFAGRTALRQDLPGISSSWRVARRHGPHSHEPHAREFARRHRKSWKKAVERAGSHGNAGAYDVDRSRAPPPNTRRDRGTTGWRRRYFGVSSREEAIVETTYILPRRQDGHSERTGLSTPSNPLRWTS
jgi:hypothetical protein